MTEALISNLLRWIVLLTVPIFLAWLIYEVFERFIDEMKASETNPRPGVWLEANWGGLGGGLSGWRVSNALIYLFLLSLLLGCLSLAVFSVYSTTEKKEQSQGEAKSDSAKKDGEKKTDDAAKKGDANDTKTDNTEPSGQKPAETKNTDSASGGKSGEKSLTAPVETKTPAVNQTGK
jgi:hypothetical protein